MITASNWFFWVLLSAVFAAALSGALRLSDRRVLGMLLSSPEGRRCIEGCPGRQIQPVVGGGVFAFIFLNERPAVREWVGILMIGAGVLILAFKK